MTPIKNMVLAITVMMTGAASSTALAYGPRDTMSYPHPSVMPRQQPCENGLKPLASTPPRQHGLQLYCPSSDDRNKSRLQLDNRGPRPRSVNTRKPRRAMRVVQR